MEREPPVIDPPTREMTDEELKADFTKHSLCVQLHVEKLEVAKGKFDYVDPMGTGLVSLPDFI